jgi:hypothetical protein
MAKGRPMYIVDKECGCTGNSSEGVAN